VIGAGSVVIGELEPYGIYYGSPARLAGHRH
jgi:acetyltransferase-like isoleucine patch superfamily enzyme